MKTIRSFCNVLLAMVVITMSACSGDDDEEIGIGGDDFKYHHQLIIEVCDEYGATLLNPNLKGCLDLSKITASALLLIIKLSISLLGKDLSSGTTTISEVVTAR